MFLWSPEVLIRWTNWFLLDDQPPVQWIIPLPSNGRVEPTFCYGMHARRGGREGRPRLARVPATANIPVGILIWSGIGTSSLPLTPPRPQSYAACRQLNSCIDLWRLNRKPPNFPTRRRIRGRCPARGTVCVCSSLGLGGPSVGHIAAVPSFL
jgi:hypothetical protein